MEPLPRGEEWVELADAARAGGAAEFAALARPLTYWITRYSRARTAAIHHAGCAVEDVVQDVLVELWKSLPTTRWASDGHLLAWVHTLTTRRIADLHRRRPVSEAKTRPGGLAGDLEPLNPAPRMGRPDRIAEDYADRQHLHQAILALARGRRAALVGRLNGERDAVLAARLGASVSAVRVARHRALAALASAIPHLSHRLS